MAYNTRYNTSLYDNIMKGRMYNEGQEEKNYQRDQQARRNRIEDEAIAEEKRRYADENAWEEENSPDLLQSLLGLGIGAGGAALAPLTGGATSGLIAPGLGMMAGGLTGKRAVNRRTGSTRSMGSDQGMMGLAYRGGEGVSDLIKKMLEKKTY